MHRNTTPPQTHLLVRAASPTSVTWRASRFSDLSDDNPDNFFKPPSVTTVKDRFKLSRLVKPTKEISKKKEYYQQKKRAILIKEILCCIQVQANIGLVRENDYHNYNTNCTLHTKKKNGRFLQEQVCKTLYIQITDIPSHLV